MAKIVIVSGSPTRQSRLHGLTGYAESYLSARHGVETLYVADLPAEDLIRANFAGEAVKGALALIEEADAVVFASPVYKASYTGVLKTFLDLIPQKGLNRKISFPLFIGGTIAHLLSIDYALKPVLAALGGTRVLGGVYAVDQWVTRGEDGSFGLDDELKRRLNEALVELSEELEWKAARTAASVS